MVIFLFAYCQDDINPGEGTLPLVIKQEGAHVFGRIDSISLQPIIENNYEWVTYVPYGWQEDFDSAIVEYERGDSLETLRRDSIWIDKINISHNSGLKVFLKPHIWIFDPTDGKWRSDIFPINDENWETWKTSYQDFILHYAKIAEESNVELFCIGVELSRLATEKPDYFREIIQEVKKVYSGQLTYAGNWYKEYEDINFWDELDYIGIQAYFPLAEIENPTVEQISDGWQAHLTAMEAIHLQYQRKILFTELGYKSTADSAITPWEWIENTDTSNSTLSFETQSNCYEAFFNTVWDQEWFEGAHIWQLRSDFVPGNEMDNLDFTPQGKPAEEIIKQAFK